MGAVTSIAMCPGNKGFFVGTSLSNRCDSSRQPLLWSISTRSFVSVSDREAERNGGTGVEGDMHGRRELLFGCVEQVCLSLEPRRKDGGGRGVSFNEDCVALRHHGSCFTRPAFSSRGENVDASN